MPVNPAIRRNEAAIKSPNSGTEIIGQTLNSGPVYNRQKVNREYGEVLKSLSSEVDIFLWERVSNLDRKIKQTYG